MSTIKYIFNEAKLEDKKNIESILRFEMSRYEIKEFHAILVFHELYNNAYLNNYCWPQVKLIFLKRSMIIRVDCKGRGFNYNKYLRMTRDDVIRNRLNESGRGIMMVEKISTRLIYNKKGNNVIAQLKEHKEEENEKS